MKWLASLLKQIFGVSGQERPSPSDIVQKTGIIADDYAQKVIIDLHQLNIPFSKPVKVWVPPIPDTNSMDGAFDIGNNNILIAGADEWEHFKLFDFLKVGDIAVYEVEAGRPVIHRIIEIGQDAGGAYYRFKGDNNTTSDAARVRGNQIKWLSIGVVY